MNKLHQHTSLRHPPFLAFCGQINICVSSSTSPGFLSLSRSQRIQEHANKLLPIKHTKLNEFRLTGAHSATVCPARVSATSGGCPRLIAQDRHPADEQGGRIPRVSESRKRRAATSVYKLRACSGPYLLLPANLAFASRDSPRMLIWPLAEKRYI